MRLSEAVEPQRMQRTQSSSRRQEALTRERATLKKAQRFAPPAVGGDDREWSGGAPRARPTAPIYLVGSAPGS